MNRQKQDPFNYLRTQKEEGGYIKHRWGAYAQQQYKQTSLLAKKDLQIKRLQTELQNERKRADSALKMLQSFRNSYSIQQQSSANTKSQVTKRLKAEQQSRRLRAQNQKLRNLLSQQLTQLQSFQKDMQVIAKK